MEFGDDINEKFVVQCLSHYNMGRCICNRNNRGHLPNDLNFDSEKQTLQIIPLFCLACSFSFVITIDSVNCDYSFITYILSGFCRTSL